MCFDFVAVIRKNIVLSQYSTSDFDFSAIISDILLNFDNNNSKVHFEKNGYKFYILHNDDELNIVVCCSNNCSADEIFVFLEKIQKLFLSIYSNSWKTAKAFEYQEIFKETLMREVNLMKNEKSTSITSELINKEDELCLKEDIDNNKQKTVATDRFKLFVIKHRPSFLSLAILSIVLVVLTILYFTT